MKLLKFETIEEGVRYLLGDQPELEEFFIKKVKEISEEVENIRIDGNQMFRKLLFTIPNDGDYLITRMINVSFNKCRGSSIAERKNNMHTWNSLWNTEFEQSVIDRLMKTDKFTIKIEPRVEVSFELDGNHVVARVMPDESRRTHILWLYKKDGRFDGRLNLESVERDILKENQ